MRERNEVKIQFSKHLPAYIHVQYRVSVSILYQPYLPFPPAVAQGGAGWTACPGCFAGGS